MDDDDVLAEFRAAEPLPDGPFILSPGLRAPRYLRCARVPADAADALPPDLAAVPALKPGSRTA